MEMRNNLAEKVPEDNVISAMDKTVHFKAFKKDLDVSMDGILEQL